MQKCSNGSIGHCRKMIGYGFRFVVRFCHSDGAFGVDRIHLFATVMIRALRRTFRSIPFDRDSLLSKSLCRYKEGVASGESLFDGMVVIS